MKKKKCQKQEDKEAAEEAKLPAKLEASKLEGKEETEHFNTEGLSQSNCCTS